MTKEKGSPGSEGARRATGEAGDARAERGRFSAKRKMAAVLRLLRGEDLDRGLSRAARDRGHPLEPSARSSSPVARRT
jgi:hypothetical protein